MVQSMIEAAGNIHCLRDATRGGLGAVLNELAEASHVGIEFDENKVPVQGAVLAACEMLGLDPLFIANEGKLVAFVPENQADRCLAAMRQHQHGQEAAIIGRVVRDHPGLVLARTSIGATRVVDLPAGELLPRIC
jgi:hydrogenase expression/formation protein HypE